MFFIFLFLNIYWFRKEKYNSIKVSLFTQPASATTNLKVLECYGRLIIWMFFKRCYIVGDSGYNSTKLYMKIYSGAYNVDSYLIQL